MLARAVDPEAILAHDPFVRGLARRLLRDAHAADDVVQQTWIAACARPLAPASLRDWLGAVAQRLAGKRVRADRRERARQQAAARLESVPSTAAVVEREALRAAIVRAVLDLAEPYRTVVLLRWFDELPPRAIARRLGLPVETVRTRHKRALADLRARLDRHAGDDRRAWSALLLPIAFGRRRVPGGGAVTAAVAGVMLMSLPIRVVSGALLLAGAFACVFWFGPGAETDLPGDPTVPTASPVALDARQSSPDTPTATSAGGAPAERERVTASDAAFGSLLVRATFHDGTPAAAVEIELSRPEVIDALASHRACTDAHGEVRFADEAPGQAVLAALRPEPANGKRCTVTAGQETLVELGLERGIDVRGVVVDARGVPVARAEIVAAGWSGRAAYVLGHSGADGTFELRSVRTHCHVGARTPAYSGSSMHTITAGEGAAVELRLVLSQPAATVAGLVFGPDDRPVEGAVVSVGSVEQDNHKLPDGTTAMAPRPMVVRTGPDGRFVARSLPAGKLPCAVRARGLAPFLDVIDVTAGERRELTVRLQAGVTLSGVVRNEQGTPVAGAQVRVGDWRSLACQVRWTGRDGAFTFTGLPVGEVKAYADHQTAGKAETTLRGEPGAPLGWDPVLSAGIVLHGRVVDERDQPVAQVILEARAEVEAPGEHWFTYAASGADGRFQLKNCRPGTPIRIDVRRHAVREQSLRDVVPGSDEVLVRLPKIEWVRIRGVAVGPEAKPLPNVQVTTRLVGAGGDLDTLDPATGAFDLGPYPPGELSLELEAPGFAPIRLRRTVQPGQTWDTGTVTFAPGGTLALTLLAETAGLAAKQDARVFDDRDDYVGFVHVEDGHGSGGPYAAGDYVLQLTGTDVAAVRRPFSIKVGAVTAVELRVQRGVPAEIVVQLPAGATADGVPVEVVEDDVVVLRASAWRRASGYVLATVLREGRYVLRVPDGPFTGERRFDVAAPGPTRAILELTSR